MSSWPGTPHRQLFVGGDPKTKKLSRREKPLAPIWTSSYSPSFHVRKALIAGFGSWFPVEDARHCAEHVAAIRLGEPPPLCSRASIVKENGCTAVQQRYCCGAA